MMISLFTFLLWSACTCTGEEKRDAIITRKGGLNALEHACTENDICTDLFKWDGYVDNPINTGERSTKQRNCLICIHGCTRAT